MAGKPIIAIAVPLKGTHVNRMVAVKATLMMIQAQLDAQIANPSDHNLVRLLQGDGQLYVSVSDKSPAG